MCPGALLFTREWRAGSVPRRLHRRARLAFRRLTGGAAAAAELGHLQFREGALRDRGAGEFLLLLKARAGDRADAAEGGGDFLVLGVHLVRPAELHVSGVRLAEFLEIQ